jgi:hypothetical protein
VTYLCGEIFSPLTSSLSKSPELGRLLGSGPEGHARNEETAMKYMFLIYRDEAAAAAGGEAMAAPYIAYSQALVNAGVMVGGDRLQSATSASTVRVANGGTKVLDGPYADTKEQLGGYYIVDVPDLDAALKWAARCPGASQGSVEVRPIWSM